MNENLQSKLLRVTLDAVITHATTMHAALESVEEGGHDALDVTDLPENPLRDLDDALEQFAQHRNDWAEAAEVKTGDMRISFEANDREDYAGTND